MADKSSKKPSLMIALGIGKKPSGGLDAPPPKYGANGGDDTPPAPGGEGPNEDESGEKVSPERAGYGGPEETCGNCENWVAPNACSKVDTVTDRGGHCWGFWEPKGGGSNMGAGGMPMMPMTPPAGGGGPQGG